jgi:glycine/D-amino acid oxidase-like deaminating enzyme
MRGTPFWIDDHPRPDRLGKAELPDETEVLIVGSGNTGLSAARELGSLGVFVTVVDAGPIGSGASSVNGGQINYGLKASTKEVFADYGPVLGRRLWDASLAAIDLVGEIVTEDEIECDFSRPGAVELAYRESDLDDLAAESRWMREHLGFETEPIPRGRMSEVIGSDHFACGLVDTCGGSIHPAKYVFGLAGSATNRGAVLVENARVEAIESRPAGFDVTTERGTITAGSVIMATNGYTPAGLVRGLRRHVVPVGSYMIATEPLDELTAERLLPKRRVAWTSRRLLHYFKRTRDNRIAIGGRQNLSTGLDLDSSAAELRGALTTIFPELDDVEITHSWTGTLGVTFDLLPHLGRIDGIWYAMGYAGHGVGLSTYLGREIGRIVGGAQKGSVFSEVPAPTRFFYRTRPWFLPAAALWYRTLDRLGR